MLNVRKACIVHGIGIVALLIHCVSYVFIQQLILIFTVLFQDDHKISLGELYERLGVDSNSVSERNISMLTLIFLILVADEAATEVRQRLQH